MRSVYLLLNIILIEIGLMGRKCCVFGCRTNYDPIKGKKKQSVKKRVYLFPKDEKKKKAWVQALPNILTVSSACVLLSLKNKKNTLF